MRAQNSGSIVLFSTVAVRQGINNHEGIAAAKAGIEGLARAGAISYARSNIRFNAVAPGLTETALTAALLQNEASRKFSAAMHPLGRVGHPEEPAAVAAFLLGPETGWITGQVWGVDGGLGAGTPPPRAGSGG
jgi:NAD(P)-dependent dehydrogenase (short-subunit alcohol dehydrogenase family)